MKMFRLIKKNSAYLFPLCVIKELDRVFSGMRFHPSSGSASWVEQPSLMTFRPTILTRFSRFTLVFLGLALAVFTWGLQYKLSLYDPPQASTHQMPSAKLLSQEEQSVVARHPSIGGEKSPDTLIHAVFPCAWILFFVIFPVRDTRAHGQNARDVSRPRHLRTFADLGPLFFRPPPVLA